MRPISYVAPAAISIPAVRQEAKFICSACGADRACDCNAPAIEKLAEITEQRRQARKSYRERKAQEKQSSRDIPAVEDNVEPATRKTGVSGKATLEEFHTAGHVIGVLERIVHDLSVLDFAKAARGCNALDVDRITRNVDQVSKLLADIKVAMGQHQIPDDDLTIPELLRRGVA